MEDQNFNCTQAKNIQLTDYLSSLGFQPQKIIHEDYWYLSPLREEKHASFKVNRKKNIWYDFGTGEGGTIIDFGIKYHHCTISQFLDKLKSSFSFHQPLQSHKSIPAGQKKKIAVIAAGPITNPTLCRYLKDRKVSLDIAKQYCKEVHYELCGKHYYAIGFPNNSGGYELRNAHFKGSIAPKDVTLFTGENKKRVAVFEGFFSFLSYLCLRQNPNYELSVLQSDFLILNSLSLLKKSRELMEKYPSVHLFLDLDKAGSKATQTTLDWGGKFKDERSCYQGHKDFNDFLISTKLNQKLQIRHRIRL